MVERGGVEPPRASRSRIYSPVHFLLRVLSKLWPRSHVSPGVTPAVHLHTLSVVITRLPAAWLGRRWVTNPGGERRSILTHA